MEPLKYALSSCEGLSHMGLVERVCDFIENPFSPLFLGLILISEEPAEQIRPRCASAYN